jgi:FKBP-type peptidyl-prolyl cis-trans isomerase FkpA
MTAACSGSNTTAPSTSSGSFTQTDLVVGTGAEATTGKSVTVTYNGWLYDTSKPDGKGSFFDGNSGFTFTARRGARRFRRTRRSSSTSL